jgi:hypothetical protein
MCADNSTLTFVATVLIKVQMSLLKEVEAHRVARG